METVRRHAGETLEKDMAAVQMLELRLEILIRWTPENSAFEQTAKMVHMRQYQRALDALEGLVVARIFKLMKMNRSQTGKTIILKQLRYLLTPISSGYALRKHIGEALQKRSAAIHTALEHYNSAARVLRPPRPPLKWDEVVEYAFLADFDLLQDTRQDVRDRPWATPAGRYALDTHFKILRACEELDRLNVEVWWVITHLRDEDVHLRAHEEALVVDHPHLAHQVWIYRMLRGRFNSHHVQQLQIIRKLPGFTGDMTPGTSVEPMVPPMTTVDPQPLSHSPALLPPTVLSQEMQQFDEEEEEEAQVQMDQEIVDILSVTLDRTTLDTP